ncbi:hypothetical protein FAIPA1_90180 [Frankia sp. AiPs1]
MRRPAGGTASLAARIDRIRRLVNQGRAERGTGSSGMRPAPGAAR